MNKNKIKVGHVYYVNFEPVRTGEFPNKHLAIVLKKNHDKISFVVIPLTGSSEGVNINKIDLGIIESLPPHLATKKSYAVFDQIRTVSYSRFEELIEGTEKYTVCLSSETMQKIYEAIIKDILFNVDDDSKSLIVKHILDDLQIN